jgi:hypothetical protein
VAGAGNGVTERIEAPAEGESRRQTATPRTYDHRACSRPYLETSGGSDPLAEFNRAIRPGVLWRKGRFGMQSAQGSQFVEALMTVVATLQQQHRHVLAYMTEACQAAYTGVPAPSLLPAHTMAEADLPVAA